MDENSVIQIKSERNGGREKRAKRKEETGTQIGLFKRKEGGGGQESTKEVFDTGDEMVTKPMREKGRGEVRGREGKEGELNFIVRCCLLFFLSWFI